MATFKHFEEIESWQIARQLADYCYNLLQKGSFLRDFKLRDQLNASSGSVMDNIAEGFGRGGNLEFIYFLSIAKGSASESQSQLYRALDRHHIVQIEFETAYQLAESSIKKIGNLIDYLNKSEIKGLKYKGRIKKDPRK